ncbi:MAG TPA: AzlC family ABC transporter permease [Solirubrobacteraceae bacterium]|nr:AzlC family ABC transporter permease [Solirubrobacteraceae bacterium]
MPAESPSSREAGTPRDRFRAGVRAGIPFALAGLLLSASFGIVARQAGLPDVAAIAMSLFVFAGSAQFAAVAIIGAGGSLGAALVAAALMNSRFLAMGIALAPSLPGGVLRRAVQGQTIVDASWAMALRTDGSFDRYFLFGATAPQYLTWSLGTVLGVIGRGAIGDPSRFGLDAVFPAFFLALLMAEVRNPRSRGVAIAGAAIALALTPFTPAGVPILAASAVALWGLASAPRP